VTSVSVNESGRPVAPALLSFRGGPSSLRPPVAARPAPRPGAAPVRLAYRPARRAPAAGTAGRPAVDDTCRRLLEDSHDLVVDTVRYVASRHRLTRDTADELRSRVMMHLAANDYAVLRRWRHESSLQSYLVSVITNVFLDYRNQEWGKAKPPAAARRGGAEAMLLWRLTHRSRLSFDDAVSVLQTQHHVRASRDELWTLYSQFPPARGRYFVGLAEVADREQVGAEADALVRQRDLDALATRVDAALAAALEDLQIEDRLILKLFFADGLTRAAIARRLGLEQARLYPRFQRLLGGLSRALAVRGVGAEEVRGLVGAATARGGDTLLSAMPIGA
jgi:RNA polymerase sigma factor (sigma-70 family)